MSRRLLFLGSLMLAVMLIASVASVTMSKPGSGPCNLENGSYIATVSTSIYNGPPPIPVCLKNVPIIKVDVTIRDHSGVIGSTSQLRCGALADAVTLNAGGRQHFVAPDAGYDWRDTLTNCSALIYKVN